MTVCKGFEFIRAVNAQSAGEHFSASPRLRVNDVPYRLTPSEDNPDRIDG
jgi:hypothetical protein